MMINRRPPTFMAVIPLVPAMPCRKPGTTWFSGNEIGMPRDHDESNFTPFLYSTPRYCTVTVEVAVAGWPLPTTRSFTDSVVAPLVLCDVTAGTPDRSVAPLTVTPMNVTDLPLAGG